MVLSSKAQKNLLVLLDQLKLEKAKTKAMAEILKKLPCKGQSSLIVLPEIDKDIILASRNLARADVLRAKDLTAWDLIQYKYLIMPKESVKAIKDTFLK